MDENIRRINGFHTWALMGAAIFTDFLQGLLTFIPIVGPFLASFLTILARIIFWIWFRLLGVGFADKPNRFIVNMSITIAEMLPLINFIPSWAVGTWVIIQQVKKEDLKKN
ncbi:hypothetical protein JXR01_02665 [Candidatus Kaiserbacteria bacterium]|nr:MAG: hypothetical protein JXR01_02665 [Candidatus Kaiserbacteria bacterium]